MIERIQEFSLPLILGVFAAMIWANVDPHTYHAAVHAPFHRFGEVAAMGSDAASFHAHGWEHYFTLHFLINDIFMVLFFGIAAKEITEACLPNGALNPVSKAINPLFATVGGVVGPIAAFLGLNYLFGRAEWQAGWGVPTATDIALAWLVVRMLFGASHPAVSFLLLLAVADDAIGLGIIAVGYPDPAHPTEWAQLVWLLPGMLSAYVMRRKGITNWAPYVLIGGAFCWWALYSAHMHPALALVFVVPFMPSRSYDEGLFVEIAGHDHANLPTLERFEHELKRTVDFGLFLFALANAGVQASQINGLSWIILASLIVGKTVGITLFSWVAIKLKFPLPEGMTFRDLITTGVVAGLGLTVALFVCGQAFVDPAVQGAARMGAVFSVTAAAAAWAVHKLSNLLAARSSSTATPEPTEA